MKLEIVTREDLNKVLEQLELPEYSGSLTALLKDLIPSYHSDLHPYLSLYLNGIKVEQTEWSSLFIQKSDLCRLCHGEHEQAGQAQSEGFQTGKLHL